ncbi:MAG: DUF58 domain-containing protein [Nocardioides sp.]
MERVRDVVGVVNPIGWVIAGFGLGLALLAALTDWREVAVFSAACLLLFLLALPFLVGRTVVRIDLGLTPERVTAGASVAASIRVTNVAGWRLLPTTLEVPVGPVTHRYGVPSLAPQAQSEENFTIRTECRGVIPVGPVLTRRGDPLGICSQDISWTGVTEIMVRPPMVPIDALGAGLLRDLEGVSTDAVSHSDLAFHALREYVPGDDLRHIHWRSSAKVMAAAGENQLLVRQYLDTRRSHATVVVDDAASAWTTEDDFETAMSIAASIIRRSILDEFEVSFVCGRRAASGVGGHLALDALCRAQLGEAGLIATATRAAVAAPDTSLLFLISGAGSPIDTFLRASAAFAPEVRRFAILIDPATTARVSEAGGLPVLHVATRDDAPKVLRWSVR